MKTIVVTGGGSGGHIAPIRAITPELTKNKKLIWIGSSNFEKNAAQDLNIEFKKIVSGKLRRGLSINNIFKNIIDMFRVEYGAWQSLFFMIRKRPEKVFSTGGFVSVPVVIAAWFLRIPIIIHEQTIGFGLANKIGAFCASKILLAFPESKKYISKKYYAKIEIVGNPIREDLLKGNFEKLQKFLGNNLDERKAILYITGGGQGSQLINKVIFENSDWLTKHFYVIHQTGKNNIEKAKKIQKNTEDYFPFAFIGDELADIYTSADIVVARSGAGTVNELAYFGIPSIFVPLQPVQDDEQMKNANWFLKNNHGAIILQKEFNKEFLKNTLDKMNIKILRRNQKIIYKENKTKKLMLENLC